jgi:hypothetical protein
MDNSFVLFLLNHYLATAPRYVQILLKPQADALVAALGCRAVNAELAKGGGDGDEAKAD